jgi:C-terminal processing protease CtpA/Prc
VISRDAAELVIAMGEGHCLLEGIRHDGLLVSRAEAVDLDVKAGDEIDVELVFPEERTGGIGIGIQEVEEGVLVTYVHPGSPAERAGLQEGDVIVEVDGLSVDALDVQDFVSVMTGPEDTPVAFVVGAESDTGYSESVLELTRAYLPDNS